MGRRRDTSAPLQQCMANDEVEETFSVAVVTVRDSLVDQGSSRSSLDN